MHVVPITLFAKLNKVIVLFLFSTAVGPTFGVKSSKNAGGCRFSPHPLKRPRVVTLGTHGRIFVSGLRGIGVLFFKKIIVGNDICTSFRFR